MIEVRRGWRGSRRGLRLYMLLRLRERGSDNGGSGNVLYVIGRAFAMCRERE